MRCCNSGLFILCSILGVSVSGSTSSSQSYQTILESQVIEFIVDLWSPKKCRNLAVFGRIWLNFGSKSPFLVVPQCSNCFIVICLCLQRNILNLQGDNNRKKPKRITKRNFSHFNSNSSSNILNLFV